MPPRCLVINVCNQHCQRMLLLPTDELPSSNQQSVFFLRDKKIDRMVNMRQGRRTEDK